jgi:hypothetical protein
MPAATKTLTPSLFEPAQSVDSKSFGVIMYNPENPRREDIKSWRDAYLCALNPYNPDRSGIYRLYREVYLDSVIQCEWGNRLERVLAMPIRVYDRRTDGKNGAPLYAQTDLLNASEWLEPIIIGIMETMLYGHRLFEFEALSSGDVIQNIFPYENISPERGLIYPDSQAKYGALGVNFRDQNAYPNVFDTNFRSTLGVLVSACPHALYKRNSMACWSEYLEVYGMPILLGVLDTQDNRAKMQFMEQLKKLGSSGRGVINPNMQIKLLEAQRGQNSDIYDLMVVRANTELSKLICGQTTTTNDHGTGGYKQSQAQDQLFDEKTKYDKRRVERILNSHIKTALINARILPAGCCIELEFEQSLSMVAKSQIDLGIADRYEVPPSYFLETYGVPAGNRLPATPNSPAAKI